MGKPSENIFFGKSFLPDKIAPSIYFIFTSSQCTLSTQNLEPLKNWSFEKFRIFSWQFLFKMRGLGLNFTTLTSHNYRRDRVLKLGHSDITLTEYQTCNHQSTSSVAWECPTKTILKQRFNMKTCFRLDLTLFFDLTETKMVWYFVVV